MPLPKAVQEANRLSEELIKNGNTETISTPEEQSTPEIENPPEDEAKPNLQEDNAENNDFTPLTDKPDPYMGGATVEELEQELRLYEHRYSTLQGKYNAEVPKLQARIKELEESSNDNADVESQGKIIQLQADVERLTRELSAKDSAPITGVEEAYDALGDEYGTDLLAGIKKYVQAATGQLQSEIKTEIKDVSSQLEQVSAKSSKDEKEAYLTSELKKVNIDYMSTNRDPLFADWLTNKKTIGGNSYMSIANDAFNNGKLDVVVNVFTAYREESLGQLAESPNSSDVPDANHLVDVKPSAPSQAEMAAPSQATTTPADVDKFYDDVRRGVYRGKEEEMRRVEQQLFASLQS